MNLGLNKLTNSLKANEGQQRPFKAKISNAFDFITKWECNNEKK